MLLNNKKEIIVAIHQPNFFPWLGYFDKIAKSDIFIFMDNVQFPKKGGTWINRVKILVNKQAQWITIPIVRSYHGIKLIKDIKINNSINWRKKILKTIELNYKKHPFFYEAWELVKQLINFNTQSLYKFNLNVIIRMSELLGLNTSKFILGSSLKVEGKATDLLISMVKLVDGTTYLCGGGASGYQEDEKFKKAGIKLIYQNFEHPIYDQMNSEHFMPGLSIIDALFNIGPKRCSQLLKNRYYSDLGHDS